MLIIDLCNPKIQKGVWETSMHKKGRKPSVNLDSVRLKSEYLLPLKLFKFYQKYLLRLRTCIRNHFAKIVYENS